MDTPRDGIGVLRDTKMAKRYRKEDRTALSACLSDGTGHVHMRQILFLKELQL